MLTLKKIAKGFTLIELMIVVAIIGILAAIAIPNFVKFQCRSKQSEAKGNLKALYTAEESYRAEYDTYFDCPSGTGAGQCGLNSTNDIGFSPKGGKIRYLYSASGSATTGFAGDATVNAGFSSELGADSWTIDQTNTVLNATNGCQ
jgi:type IV pilus assembly protein PilA